MLNVTTLESRATLKARACCCCVSICEPLPKQRLWTCCLLQSRSDACVTLLLWMPSHPQIRIRVGMVYLCVLLSLSMLQAAGGHGLVVMSEPCPLFLECVGGWYMGRRWGWGFRCLSGSLALKERRDSWKKRSYIESKFMLRAGQMSQQVKVLAAKSDVPSLILGPR